MSGKAGELVYMLATVSESDLEQVDAEIEQELENIAKLRSVRKVIADLLGVKATRKSKKTTEVTPAGDEEAEESTAVDASEDKINAACHIAAKLLHRNPMAFADIRRQAKLHPGILGKALKTDWFTKLADGRFALSDAGLEYADL